MIAEAFVVVVVGGLGSVTGAYLAAVLIGVLHAFGILILPKITLVLVFLVMAVVLVVRPHGLLGKAAVEPARRHRRPADTVLRPADARPSACWPALVAPRSSRRARFARRRLSAC